MSPISFYGWGKKKKKPTKEKLVRVKTFKQLEPIETLVHYHKLQSFRSNLAS